MYLLLIISVLKEFLSFPNERKNCIQFCKIAEFTVGGLKFCSSDCVAPCGVVDRYQNFEAKWCVCLKVLYPPLVTFLSFAV